MKEYSLNLKDKKFKLANKLKEDLFRKNKKKYIENNYLPEVLYNDIINILSTIDIDKFPNFNLLINTIERSINKNLPANKPTYCLTSESQSSVIEPVQIDNYYNINNTQKYLYNHNLNSEANMIIENDKLVVDSYSGPEQVQVKKVNFNTLRVDDVSALKKRKEDEWSR